MSTEVVRDPKVPIIEKQVKFLHQILKLKQLMDDAVHALIEEVNSQGISAY